MTTQTPILESQSLARAPETRATTQASDDAGSFRLAMRRLASGVALVTTADAAGQPCGIAMTAFMSLTMEPPALLIAVNQTASLCPPLLERGSFAVNILSEAQAAACNTFVATPSAERFGTVAWSGTEEGIPIVHGAVATILCSVDKAEPFGSHMIVRGLVQRVMLGESERPLAYLDGRYGVVSFND